MIQHEIQLIGTRVRTWTTIGVVYIVVTTGNVLLTAEWPDQQQIGPFVCHADFSLDPFVPLFHDLVNLQQDLISQLGVDGTKETIHLYLFSKKSTYQQYLRRHFPEVPKRRALFIKGRGPGMVFAYASGDFQTDLRHECTHALLHASLPMVPLWLDEGLAEYFELPMPDRLDSSPHRSALRRNLLFRQHPSLTKLESLSSLENMDGRDYRYAWAWVHFMLHGSPATKDELQKFLNDIDRLTPPGKLSQRLANRVPDLEQKFRQHFRHVRGIQR